MSSDRVYLKRVYTSHFPPLPHPPSPTPVVPTFILPLWGRSVTTGPQIKSDPRIPQTTIPNRMEYHGRTTYTWKADRVALSPSASSAQED